ISTQLPPPAIPRMGFEADSRMEEVLEQKKREAVKNFEERQQISAAVASVLRNDIRTAAAIFVERGIRPNQPVVVSKSTVQREETSTCPAFTPGCTRHLRGLLFPFKRTVIDE